MTLSRSLAALLLLAACRTPATDKEDGTIGVDDTGQGGPVDADGDGWPASDDCDDEDASANPGAAEVCDGVDNDCDGEVDDGLLTAWYPDDDDDGHGDASAEPVESCEEPEGHSEAATDCDDADASVYPDAPELCDGIDNDCDGVVDEDDSVLWYPDADDDGYGDADADPVEDCAALDGHVLTATDCDDTDPDVSPEAVEVCNEIDDDCDGLVDDDDDSLALGTATTWYVDADEDGHGDPDSAALACAEPAGHTTDDTDCDDTDPDVSPTAQEVCNGVDDDCDELVDDDDDSVDPTTGTAWYSDGDSDGYGDPDDLTWSCEQPSGTTADDTDCDDDDDAVNPAATEVCNELDDDCDGSVDDDDADLDTTTATTWYADDDADGYGDADDATVACEQPSGTTADDTDCDDDDDAVNPAATEVCNELDDDCDGSVDDDDADLDTTTATTWYADDDADGYGDADDATVACDEPSGTTTDDTDCDDTDDAVHPGATETCDWVDEDCDGTVDDGLDDDDGSGVADCKEVAVVASFGFVAASSSYTCDGDPIMDRELDELDAFLGDLGLTGVYFEDDGSTGVAHSDVSHYPIVVYHNGGWSAASTATTLSMLEDAAAAGQSLFFLGDDVLKHAWRHDSAGSTTIYDLTYTTGYSSNGTGGVGAVVATSSHDVMDGAWGAVGDWAYVADIDVGSAAGAGETVLMTLDGSSSPAVIAAEDGAQRTVVAIASLYNSEDCPISDTAGLGELEVLFKNAVWWLGGWE